ncbi:MAG: leucyl aminopeptidase family protein [Streptosporangiaceae bacterium]
MPVDIDVTTVAAAERPLLDDFLTRPGGTAGASLLAVPVRRPEVRRAPGEAGPGKAGTGKAGEAGDDGNPDWASLTGVGAAALATVTGLSAAEAISAYDLTGQAGEVIRVAARTPDGVIPLILLGVGDGTPADFRRAGAALARHLQRGQKAVAALPDGATGNDADAFTEGLLLGGYKFSMRDFSMRDKFSMSDKAASSATAGASPDGASPDGGRSVRLLLPEAPEAGDRRPARAPTIAAAVALARDLINTPSGIKTPDWLAARAVEVAERHGLGVRVRDTAELARDGFGGIVAVGAGSEHPPCMIQLTYAPADAGPHVVLAGKGITFDSGGLSLKPNDGMKLMKTDMAGGAAVIAAMSALAALGVRARVTGLIAAAENMPSGSAMRPGDIISTFGGRTVEVLNTDAEGRLVLADLLAYAGAALDPFVTVDLATLTGAARIALGASVGALYASDDELASALTEAGAAAGEPLWRMPMPADYVSALTSATADLAHIPSSMNGARNGQAGSIVAAMFLREFTGGRRWAHLDIAGPARAGGDDGEITKGGTGFGTRLLLHWLTS